MITREHTPPQVSARRRSREAGLTVLELIIVIAIIGLFAYVGYSGFRMLTHAALADDVNELTAVMRRSQVLSVEAGVPVRVVIDFDHQQYWVEACTGDPTLRHSKEEEKVDAEAVAGEVAKARERLSALPPGALPPGSVEDQAKMALALAGKTVGGRVCHELSDAGNKKRTKQGEVANDDEVDQALALDSDGRTWHRSFNTGKGVKVREVWVQHLESSVSSGTVSITFFPLGYAEKAIIEVGDDRDDLYSVLIFGLTGRVEVRDGALHNPDDHMLRNVKGEREAERSAGGGL